MFAKPMLASAIAASLLPYKYLRQVYRIPPYPLMRALVAANADV